mmetsp:Transcript_30039/g.73165  ORF Transcript_30039/g.73165 Transcript_30039/m.73165 type:complete len:211 (-) Transcript_30039:1078-1710(-)
MAAHHALQDGDDVMRGGDQQRREFAQAVADYCRDKPEVFEDVALRNVFVDDGQVLFVIYNGRTGTFCMKFRRARPVDANDAAGETDDDDDDSADALYASIKASQDAVVTARLRDYVDAHAAEHINTSSTPLPVPHIALAPDKLCIVVDCCDPYASRDASGNRAARFAFHIAFTMCDERRERLVQRLRTIGMESMHVSVSRSIPRTAPAAA